MANKPKVSAEEEVSVEQTVQVPKGPTESVYTAEDLIANHKVFRTSKAVVKVALMQAGKKTATLAEARTIIDKFRNKEVK